MTIDKLNSEVMVMQKDIGQIMSVVERIEVTISKLTDVSASVSQLLAVQDNKLGYHEKTLAKLAEEISEQRKNTETIISEQQKNIDRLELDIEKDMDKFQDKLFKELQSLREEMNESNTQINTKITKIERMIYTALGGGIVLVFILQELFKFVAG